MFNPGNKIIITGSSVKKNKLGPKINSIGYIKEVNTLFLELEDYFISTMKIVFNRFGNEKLLRSEIKLVPILFPNKMKTINNFNLTTQQSFLQNLNDKTKYKLKDYFYTKNLCTIGPLLTNTQEKKFNAQERKCYLLSLWTHHNLFNDLNRIKRATWYDRYKIKNIRTILDTIFLGLSDTKFKHENINNLIYDMNRYKEFIKILKLITLRSTFKVDIEFTDDDNDLQFAYKTLYLNLFNKHYDNISRTILNKQTQNNKKEYIRNIINNLNHVKQLLITNGRKYT